MAVNNFHGAKLFSIFENTFPEESLNEIWLNIGEHETILVTSLKYYNLC